MPCSALAAFLQSRDQRYGARRVQGCGLLRPLGSAALQPLRGNMKIKKACAAVSAVFVLCGGCAVDATTSEEGGMDPESAMPSESDESVAATQEALGARRLHYHSE